MARILLGVSGGIAAYKALELARLATLAGHGVRVLMTPAAQRFVGSASFEGIVGAPVLDDEFERDPLRGAFPGDPLPDHDPIGHLELAANADLYLIAPASANTIAKLAAGIADSMLTTSFLACPAPRVVAPAMNDRMYGDPATQANLATLRERGVRVIEPEEGALASRGEMGVGRLPSPDRLLAEVEALLPAARGSWDGLRVLVTAGGTREPIDSVRFIGNRSSGRMGLALAEAGPAARGGGDPGRGKRLAFRAGRRAADRRRDRGRAGGGRAGGVPRLPRAVDGRRGRRLPAGPGARRGRSPAREAVASSFASSKPRTCSRTWRRCAATTRRWSASPPSTAPRRSSGLARSSSERGWTRSSSTTSRAPRSASTRR